MQLNQANELYPVYIDLLDNIFMQQKMVVARSKSYLRGKNPTLLNKPEQRSPDNRVPTPIARKITKTIKGYVAKPGHIQYKAETPEYMGTVKDIFDDNDEELLTAELFYDALGVGFSFEVLRVDEDLNIKQYKVGSDDGLMIFDDTLSKDKLAFIHRSTVQRVDGNVIRDYDVQTIYYKDFFVEYTRPNGQGSKGWIEVDRKDHPFGDVPAIMYRNSDENVPIFESVIPLIDEHDKIISSNYSNEMERFAQAYLMALKRITKDVADKVQEIKIFDDLGGGGDIKNASDALAFLVKPSRGDDVREGADRFERLIYDQAMVVNLADLALGANMSSKALRDKILLMEWLASDIEAYFSRGLQERLLLIANAVLELYKIQPEMVTISFRRNLPIELDLLARTAGDLAGILSIETILATVFPADIVPDIEAELERLRGTVIPLGEE